MRRPGLFHASVGAPLLDHRRQSARSRTSEAAMTIEEPHTRHGGSGSLDVRDATSLIPHARQDHHASCKSYFIGTSRFSSSVQFWIKIISVTLIGGCSLGSTTRSAGTL